MTLNRKLLIWTGLSFLLLAACDGSDVMVGDPQSQFGPAFAAAFNAAPTDDPAEDLTIIYRGVTGVSLTEQPIDL